MKQNPVDNRLPHHEDTPRSSIQAANMIGIQANTLAIWRILGRGPAYHKVGRRIVYFDRDIDAWLSSCRIDPEGRRLRLHDHRKGGQP
ncbi:MAG: helix-turn-helix transcriptional regulator [Desulfatirhabdiaceae bacterium]